MIDAAYAPLWLTLVVGAGFMFDWLAVASRWGRVKYASKPLAMALVIAWTLAALRGDLTWLAAGLMAAQIFGLLGDIFLMFPEWGVIPGLGSFLLGHLFYISVVISLWAQRGAAGGLRALNPTTLLIGALIGVAVLLLFARVMLPKLRQGNRGRGLTMAIFFYASVLTGFTALSFIFVWHLPGGILGNVWLPIGSFLFLISDFLLAYDRFAVRIPKGRLWVRITYHLAQFCLAAGLVSQITVLRA